MKWVTAVPLPLSLPFLSPTFHFPPSLPTYRAIKTFFFLFPLPLGNWAISKSRRRNKAHGAKREERGRRGDEIPFMPGGGSREKVQEEFSCLPRNSPSRKLPCQGRRRSIGILSSKDDDDQFRDFLFCAGLRRREQKVYSGRLTTPPPPPLPPLLEVRNRRSLPIKKAGGEEK